MGTVTPAEARWVRSAPRCDLPAAVLERMVHRAFPRSRMLAIEHLADGLRNANFKVHLDSSAGAVVLRVYEHDLTICQKELDLLGLLAGRIPVPEAVHAEPQGLDDIGPFMILRYVEGISFRELVRSRDQFAIAEAACCAGETLAAIGRFTFEKAGWLGPGLVVTAKMLEDADPVPRFVDSCLASPTLQQRVSAELIDATHALIWSRSGHLRELGYNCCLVHGDFSKRNLLMRADSGRWQVASVIDWEFAVAGSPLADVASFLRYEHAARPVAEPHFSTGYLRARGSLPEDWSYLARVYDISVLCKGLTETHLSDNVVMELIELVRATVENRDPQL